MNLLFIILFALEAIIGVSSSAYIIISLIVTIIMKIYRAIRYKASLYD